jgi:hypothetical protein
MVEHLLLDVDDGELAVRPQPWCHVQGLQAGAGTDLKDPLAGARPEQDVKAPAGKQRQWDVEQAALPVGVRRLVIKHRGDGDGGRYPGGRGRRQ